MITLICLDITDISTLCILLKKIQEITRKEQRGILCRGGIQTMQRNLKHPLRKGVELTGALVIGGYVANKVRKIRNLESRIKAGNELYARNMASFYQGGPPPSMSHKMLRVYGVIFKIQFTSNK